MLAGSPCASSVARVSASPFRARSKTCWARARSSSSMTRGVFGMAVLQAAVRCRRPARVCLLAVCPDFPQRREDALGIGRVGLAEVLQLQLDDLARDAGHAASDVAEQPPLLSVAEQPEQRAGLAVV